MPSVSLNGESVRKRQQEEVIESRQFLTFLVGTESFAMPIASIREIIEFGGLTEVPLMPDFLRGVINLRGSVVPVIDLSVRFGRAPTMEAKRTCIIIMELVQDEQLLLLGVMVDAVSAVLSIGVDHIEPRPSFGAGIRADFIEGMINVNERFIVVLDVQRVLSVDELASLLGMSAEDALGGVPVLSAETERE
ncbi:MULTISPECIES: chemotaxis protein CheW [Herbaspirillum]|jgi:purine-binding chemotaxis protein CheW|nr:MULTISPECIES: chemotaxis protein CheW [Herbaspirillum]MAF03480.1 chemotaxis protein CheW [Herbaspirillum sp.]MBO15825.1 chemotaxis protein CheW [Herbaspirillum sp.]MCP3658288.1 purine-binding chemotaxis protein CheW [Herbaspirillum sp.]MCP3950276.1 purine-binding chemotaxis protein CheW [Herbaspirillum sp.]MCP4033640.1 purine-binding chemotaxis protein CheW [Herbaspirillum sp.]|tara:strand:+ start:142 stop:717 length:576 start_codon:yes stop_codon:yes gene_type:complete